MKRIADISSYQMRADLVKMYQEGGIDGFIFRLGYGNNHNYQDDMMFHEFVSTAIKNNIPWGAYIFSYALTDSDLRSEIDHTLRMLDGNTPPLGVWWDLENSDYKEKNGFNDIRNGEMVSDFAKTYIKAMNENGCIAGIYCDLNHYINIPGLHDIEHKWIACYQTNPDPANPPVCDCDIWQYTSQGDIMGNDGNADLNYIYASWINNILENKEPSDAASNHCIVNPEPIIFDGGNFMEREMSREQLKYEVNRHALTLFGREIGDADTYVDFLKDGDIDWYEFDRRLQESEEGVKRWIKYTLFIDILDRIPDETEVNWWYAQYQLHYEMNKALMVENFKKDYEAFKNEYINKQV